MIAFEVDQPKPKDYARAEYYIPSHVPPARVRQFFIGFSNWHDVHTYLSQPKNEQAWYRVELGPRDDHGRPTDFTITPITHSTERGTESWTAGEEAWKASDPDSKAFEARHPLLAKTFEAIHETLSATR